MWDQIIAYFDSLEEHPVQRMAFLVGSMLILWMLEGAIPLLVMTYKKNKVRHAMVNFSFTILHLLIHTGLAIIFVLLSDWCYKNQFGIVYLANASIFWTIVISFFVLDFFGGWLVHIIEHKVNFLWRFHVVHHADNNVDVTTGLRHHPVESVLRGVFFMMGIVLSGSPMYAIMIFQTLLVIATQITHANISLPRWLDKAASYFFVSPNMHKVHHHWKQPYTDSNYGGILSIWDRLLGTFMTLEPKDIRYGLDRYYPNEKDEDFATLIKKPFQKLDP
ncbi:MAG TPA: sterol desaturase family protein [Chitinophagaceae bacterium]|nr:sterol desaturase family protein [Chitinophagaceae bacterium]